MNEIINNDQEKCDQVLAALYHVIDPEIGLNIVDLGLLYQIDFDEGNRIISISMTLTTQFCPMGDSIRNQGRNAMQQAFPQYSINIELVFNPPWSPELVSEQGQLFLNR